MLDITIRAAESDDAIAVAKVLIESRKQLMSFAESVHTDDETLFWVKSLLIPTESVFVAVTEHFVVGVVSVSRDEEFSWISQLYVDPLFVHMGIGTRLLNHALEILTGTIRLYTFQENTMARKFYEKHGFKAIAFSNGEDNEESCPDVLYEIQMDGPTNQRR